MFIVNVIGYQVVALILLLSVSFVAMIFDILPVMMTAVLSALLWNFFFIPPLYKFTIGSPEDVLLFLMYFAIAMMNAVLTSKIRKAEIRAKEKEEKEKTINLYNTLLNSLSHELRTPISTILGAADALKQSPSKLSKAHQVELLSEIDIACTRLNIQVENLLNMSRLQSGFIKPYLDWCDMVELIYGIIQSHQRDDSKHIIIFEPEENIPLFKIDHGLIEQVIQNLLHNAIQHTPDGSIINIRVKHHDSNCVIIISDNGPGFPENKTDAVFEKFYKLSGSATGGTGLGLSIVKGLIEAMNGTVILENLPERKGARFTISIPAETSYLSDFQNE